MVQWVEQKVSKGRGFEPRYTLFFLQITPETLQKSA